MLVVVTAPEVHVNTFWFWFWFWYAVATAAAAVVAAPAPPRPQRASVIATPAPVSGAPPARHVRVVVNSVSALVAALRACEVAAASRDVETIQHARLNPAELVHWPRKNIISGRQRKVINATPTRFRDLLQAAHVKRNNTRGPYGCYYHQHTPAPLPGWGTIARAATLYLGVGLYLALCAL